MSGLTPSELTLCARIVALVLVGYLVAVILSLRKRSSPTPSSLSRKPQAASRKPPAANAAQTSPSNKERQ